MSSSAAPAPAVAAAAEELHGLGDDLDGLALRPVLGFPLAPVEASVDADGPALGEVLGAAFALVAPHGHVEVVRLVAPLARGLILLAGVHGQPELAHCGSARGVSQLGILRQIPDQDDAVDVGHGLLLPRSNTCSDATRSG
jgi:hypothetical protein